MIVTEYILHKQELNTTTCRFAFSNGFFFSFFVECFTCAPDSFQAGLLGHMAQMLGFDFLSGEILLQPENSTGHRWDSNPGPCR